jgi:hypothetical protein
MITTWNTLPKANIEIVAHDIFAREVLKHTPSDRVMPAKYMNDQTRI